MSLRNLFSEPRFDWYQVTFFENVDPYKVLESAYLRFEGCSMQVAEHVLVKQYKRGVNVFLSGQRLFHLCIGGSGGDRPHIIASGSGSHRVYEWLRDDFPGAYSVARCDVCLDTVEPGMFDYLSKTQLQYANDCRIAIDQAGDWLAEGSPNGRTLYIGSRKKGSQAHTRTYEKGKQLKGEPEWVRFEVEVRPQHAPSKKKVALMTPFEVLVSVPWVKIMFLEMMHEHFLLERGGFAAISTTWVPTDDQRALIACMKQYGGVMERFVATLPEGWSDLGLALHEIREVYRENKKAKGGLGLNPYDEVIRKLSGGGF